MNEQGYRIGGGGSCAVIWNKLGGCQWLSVSNICFTHNHSAHWKKNSHVLIVGQESFVDLQYHPKQSHTFQSLLKSMRLEGATLLGLSIVTD